jgi:hypothetical protein
MGDAAAEPRLRKVGDGRYEGSYAGRPFTVWKQRDRRFRLCWRAATDDLVIQQNIGDPTRAGAVRRLCRDIDMAAVYVPEVEQLLKRWGGEIKAVALRLKDRDLTAHTKLVGLRSLLEWFDDSARLKAVSFERQLAELKAHIVAPERHLHDEHDNPLNH